MYNLKSRRKKKKRRNIPTDPHPASSPAIPIPMVFAMTQAFQGLVFLVGRETNATVFDEYASGIGAVAAAGVITRD